MSRCRNTEDTTEQKSGFSDACKSSSGILQSIKSRNFPSPGSNPSLSLPSFQKVLIPQVPHHILLTAGKRLSKTLTHIVTLSEGLSPGRAEGRLRGSRWRSVCGAGIRGRSGFTIDTHREQLTASLPLVSGDVLHTKPLCPPPKHALLSQRAGSLVSPPSHCPLSLSLSLLFLSLFFSSAKQISSSNCNLYPKVSLSKRASATVFHPSLCPTFSVLLSLSSLFLSLNLYLSIHSFPPHEPV